MGGRGRKKSEAKTSKADPGEDKLLPRPRAVEVSVRPLRPPSSASLSFQPIRENTGDKCPLQWTSSPRSPLVTMGRHLAGTRAGLPPPATSSSSSSFFFQRYNITVLPSVNTLIARGMFRGARYTHSCTLAGSVVLNSVSHRTVDIEDIIVYVQCGYKSLTLAGSVLLFPVSHDTVDFENSLQSYNITLQLYCQVSVH